MKTNVNTSKAPAAIGPYSQAIVKDNFVFTSGQIHLTPDGKLLEGIIEEQTHQVMKNLAAIIEAADVSLRMLLKRPCILRTWLFMGK